MQGRATWSPAASRKPVDLAASIYSRIRSVGDTRTGTGVGPSFEDLPVLKGTYARPLIYTRSWTTPRSGAIVVLAADRKPLPGPCATCTGSVKELEELAGGQARLSKYRR